MSLYHTDPGMIPHCEEFIIKGHQRAFRKKMYGLQYGKDGYTKNLAAAREFNESLVAERDLRAIGRKIEELETGYYYSYEKIQFWLGNLLKTYH